MKVLIYILASFSVALAKPASSVYLPSVQSPNYNSVDHELAQHNAPTIRPQHGVSVSIPSSNVYLPASQTPKPSSSVYLPSSQTSNYNSKNDEPTFQYGTPTANSQHGGSSDEFQDGYNDDDSNSYHFKYDVQDPESGNDFGHEEERHGDEVHGKYYVLLPDGRRQIVEYVANKDGFKPKISYEQA